MIRPKIETTTQLTVAPNPAIVGQVGHADRDRHHRGAATPTGTVTFFIDGQASRPCTLAEQTASPRRPCRRSWPPRPISSPQFTTGNSTFAASVLECRDPWSSRRRGRRTDRRPPGPIRVPLPAHDAGADLRQVARSDRAQDLQNYRLVNSNGEAHSHRIGRV